MREKPPPISPSTARRQIIIEVEGYDGDSGSIGVTNYRADPPESVGVSHLIYCIGELMDDGVVRFHDWGYATAEEARRALRWTTDDA